jgi:hypothetical protein
VNARLERAEMETREMPVSRSDAFMATLTDVEMEQLHCLPRATAAEHSDETK